MVDWEDEIAHKDDRQRILLEDLPDPSNDIASARAICQEEQEYIDKLLPVTTDSDCAFIRSEVADISPVLCEQTFCSRLIARNELSQMMCSIGSCDANDDTTLFGDIPTSPGDEIELQDLDDEAIMDHIFASVTNGTIDLEDVPLKEAQVSSTYARPKEGLDAQHLSKVWSIDLPTAKRTLEVTTQHQVQTDDQKLARNYGTNDRMLRYKRIHQYFFMDTFFASKKHGLSSRKNSCCQLFVTDTGFVYVVPMKAKSEVLDAVKQFAKEIGAPDAIIADASREQTKSNLRKFLQSIGTSLRVLEEGTPWSNKAELYIGLIKEAVRKDLYNSNCPLAFWDYCVERRARINNLTAKDMFKLRGQNAYATVHGETGDISNLWKVWMV